mgnify:CR=1 FL=1
MGVCIQPGLPRTCWEHLNHASNSHTLHGLNGYVSWEVVAKDYRVHEAMQT